MNPTKRQLEVALKMAVTEAIDGPEYCLMFKSSVYCGKFGYCGDAKCVKAQIANFLKLALDKIGKEKKA